MNIKKVIKFKFSLNAFVLLYCFCSITAHALVPVPAEPQTKPIALVGGTAHLGTGEVIEDAILTFENGKITHISNAKTTQINLNKYEIIRVTNKHIYPGFILPTTNLGLWEVESVRATIDYRELGEFNPNVRSIIAYNTDSELIPTLRFNGILLAQTTPVGGVISGTSSVVKLDAWNWQDAAYKIDDGIHIHWPEEEEFFPFEGEELPPFGDEGDLDDGLKTLTQLFEDAQLYAKNPSPPATNLKLQALQGLFEGSQRLYMHTDSAKSIVASIKFARKFAIKNIIIVGGKDALLVKKYLIKENVPILINGLHTLPSSNDDAIDLPFRVPFLMQQAGLKIGLTYPNNHAMSARNLPFTAGTAAAYGMDKEAALQLITKNNAEILGIADRVGSLEVGKDATLFVSSGDALDMRGNNLEYAFIQGGRIKLQAQQQELYERYKKRYLKK